MQMGQTAASCQTPMLASARRPDFRPVLARASGLESTGAESVTVSVGALSTAALAGAGWWWCEQCRTCGNAEEISMAPYQDRFLGPGNGYRLVTFVKGHAMDKFVEILRAGGLVAIPTETVYGLAADASNPKALELLYQTKGRPGDHPVIVHLASADQLSQWALDIPPAAHELAHAHWPGPLTLILRRQPHVLDEVTGGQDTVGLRVPGHPLALELLRLFGGGLAAPSANRFGHVSPTRAEHVRKEFPEVPVLDGGPCQVGLESTIVDCTGDTLRVLRPGAIELDASTGPSAVRAPGTLDRHYQPGKPCFRADPLPQLEPGDGVLTWREPVPAAVSLHLGSDSAAYGRGLYAALRELDESLCTRILVETPPAAWAAVSDRVRRATSEL